MKPTDEHKMIGIIDTLNLNKPPGIENNSYHLIKDAKFMFV